MFKKMLLVIVHSLGGTIQMLGLVTLNKIAMHDSSQFQLIIPAFTIEGRSAKMEESQVQTLMGSGSGIIQMKDVPPAANSSSLRVTTSV